MTQIDDSLDEAARDFERVAEALAYLGERWRERPRYVDAAAKVGLSPHHFHRIFTRWTGLSPKQLVDAYAHDEARTRLDAGDSVLDAAYEVGLSGPSRLHDLFIAQEAATPGEARRKGEGLRFDWGAAATPFGIGVFLIAPRGLSALAFTEPGEAGIAIGFEDLRARFPAASFVRDDHSARDWARRVFVERGPLPLALYGSPWQRQVWRALLTIPDGATTTYGDLAHRLGRPAASRAVGAAVGRNPVSYLIPCHRVLASDGRLTGYHWGVDRKRAMLAWEAARRAVGR